MLDDPITPRGVKVANPAFDVTPNKLIAAIITDRGVAKPPFKRSLARLLKADPERAASSKKSKRAGRR